MPDRILRAVGGIRKQVHRMVAAEAQRLAAVGTAFGILAGNAIGLACGALAAFIPKRQAAPLQLVEALRTE